MFFDTATPDWDSWTGLLESPLIPRTDGPQCGLSHGGWLCSLPAGHEAPRHLAGGAGEHVFHAWPATHEPTPADLAA